MYENRERMKIMYEVATSDISYNIIVVHLYQWKRVSTDILAHIGASLPCIARNKFVL